MRRKLASFRVITINDDQIERQRHMEYAVRFLVHSFVPYDGKLDVEEYIDEGIVKLAGKSDGTAANECIGKTFHLLNEAAGSNALRRYENGRYVGKVGLVGLEGIAVGVAKNLKAISRQSSPKQFLQKRIKDFWAQTEVESFTSLGLRGTTRLQRTIPFGENWFRP